MTSAAVRRTPDVMADGRQLFYFDDTEPYLSGKASRSVPDTRPLGAAASAGERRRDPLTGDWVVLAAHRMDRTFLPPADECPLCPSRDGKHTEVPSADYEVVVFENRFPSLSVSASPDDPGADPARLRPGTGRCEVVCFTPDHDASFASLSPQQVRTVLEAWVDRTLELRAVPGVVQVFPFENRGEEIGVTLGHPHGQVYAYPFVPPRAARLLAAERRHHAGTGRHLSDDILAEERADGRRIVVQDEAWTAFVPVAARWPFEVHLYPNERVPDLPSLSEHARDAFGPVYLEVLRRLDGLFDVPMPYIAAWNQAPSTAGPGEAALHLTLFSTRRGPGKLKFLAGSESAAGVFINDILPERAAEMLRAVAL